MEERNHIAIPRRANDNLAASLSGLEAHKSQVEAVVAAIRDALEVPDDFVLLVGGDGLLVFGRAEVVEE